MADKKVVIPDDMGAGLKFENDKWNVNAGKGLTINQTTNQIEIKTGGGAGGTGDGSSTGVGIDDDGRLITQISTDAGNLLELRENGLYYGIYPIQSQFYVDSTEGNDNNDGATPERPMRTIQKAMDSMIDGPYSYTIYLRALKNYDWVYKALYNTSSITFRVYGHEIAMYPDSIPSNPLYQGYLAKSFPRPNINIRVKPHNGSMTRHYLWGEYTLAMFIGISFRFFEKAENDDDTLQGSFSGFLKGNTAEFRGCTFEFMNAPVQQTKYTYRADSLFRSDRVLLLSCQVKNRPNSFGNAYFSRWLYPDSSSFFTHNLRSEGYLDGFGEYPDYPIFDTAEDCLPNLPLNVVKSYITYNTQTKTLFGLNVNWDIFQYS